MTSLAFTIVLSFLLTGIKADLTPPDIRENETWMKKNWIINDETNLDLSPKNQNQNDSGMKKNLVIKDETDCTGPMGTVTGVGIEVTDTEMKVSYKPPLGFEDCDLDYKVVYWQGFNLAVYQQTFNKNLNQSYNYWEGRALCKLIELSITPSYNGVPGETYDSNQFTDKFTPHIDIGPIRNLRLTVTDILHIKWWTPIDYDTCPFVFFIETTDLYTGEVLNYDGFQGFEWKYDYAADNNYCRDVEVKVESYFREVRGGIVSAVTRLGPPPSGSC